MRIIQILFDWTYNDNDLDVSLLNYTYRLYGQILANNHEHNTRTKCRRHLDIIKNRLSMKKLLLKRFQ